LILFPPCRFDLAILEEGVGNHCHERMTGKALPGSALEVIETEFFFQLLVSLRVNPSRLGNRDAGAIWAGRGSQCGLTHSLDRQATR
jgi:hypothetical protein